MTIAQPPAASATHIDLPFWRASVGNAPPRPPLGGTVVADVAIVGGGIAGSSIALHLAEAGFSVALVEAGTLAEGAAGTSAGVVAPQLVRATPDMVRRKLGDEAGADVLRLVGEGGTYLFDLIARHGIACDAAQNGFLAPATGRGAVRKLSARVAQWQGTRSDLRVCDAQETGALTGCRGYAAAILDPTGGSIDPLALVRGLADRAEALGARIHENSAATAIERASGGWRVRTASGEILARRVVMAANGGNAALRAELVDTVLPLPVNEVATEPLAPDMRASILPYGHSLTDLEPDVFSIRYTGDGRLITAFPAGTGDDADTIARNVNRRLAEMLDMYRPLRIDYAWRGDAFVNSSLLPRLIGIDDGLVAVQACNGRGLAINMLLGREVTRAFVGGGDRPLLPFADARPISGFRLARHVPRMLLSSALLVKRLRRRLGVS